MKLRAGLDSGAPRRQASPTCTEGRSPETSRISIRSPFERPGAVDEARQDREPRPGGHEAAHRLDRAGAEGDLGLDLERGHQAARAFLDLVDHQLDQRLGRELLERDRLGLGQRVPERQPEPVGRDTSVSTCSAAGRGSTRSAAPRRRARPRSAGAGGSRRVLDHADTRPSDRPGGSATGCPTARSPPPARSPRASRPPASSRPSSRKARGLDTSARIFRAWRRNRLPRGSAPARAPGARTARRPDRPRARGSPRSPRTARSTAPAPPGDAALLGRRDEELQLSKREGGSVPGGGVGGRARSLRRSAARGRG
jgi:hypothetical protein